MNAHSTHSGIAQRLAAAGWILLGFTLPVALLSQARVTPHAALWLALTACLVASMSYVLQFQLGSRRALIYPGDAPIVLAALYLAPAQAAIACIVGFAVDSIIHRHEIAPWKTALSAAQASISVIAASLIFDAAWPATPGVHGLLAAAATMSALFKILDGIQYAIGLQIMSGTGRAFVRDNQLVIPFEIGLTSATVAIVAPFQDAPIALAIVLGVVQLGVYALSRITTSETLHRSKSQYLQETFSRYVPEHMAQQLAESGQEIRLGGEERVITVLFCDIRGFTSWSEKVEPELVISELNTLLGMLSDAVMETGGTLDKYTGDGLMAFWGAPLEQPDHAERATNAALAMLRALGACNEQRAVDGLPPFAIGIGVHSGRAVVGNVGSERRLDYTAIGDTVNLSARLEAATKTTGSPVLLSESTLDALSPDLAGRFELSGEINVKGRQQPVSIAKLRISGESGSRAA